MPRIDHAVVRTNIVGDVSLFVIIALLASAAPVTFMYEDAEKAWAKVRTLQRTGASFELRDGRTEMPLSVAELEEMLRRK